MNGNISELGLWLQQIIMMKQKDENLSHCSKAGKHSCVTLSGFRNHTAASDSTK